MQPVRRTCAVRSMGASDCPFLYQTRSILQTSSRSQQARSITSRNSLQNHGSIGETVSNDNIASERAKPASFLKRKAAEVTSNKAKTGQTITSAEQAAFDSIRELFKKPSPSNSKARATSTNHTDTDYKNILDLFASLPKDMYLNASNKSAQETTGRSKFGQTDAQVESEFMPEQKDDFMTKVIPESTSRLSHENSMAEIDDFLGEAAPSTKFMHSPDESIMTAESVALDIVESVADSLKNALASQKIRPDIVMWRVAEKQIFPLTQLLRPSMSTLSSSVPSQLSGGTLSQPEAAQDPTDSKNTDQPHPLIPSDIPVLPVLSQAYPSLTLLILRLYAAHHPTSPYALSLLPTLKSLGPTSYVLGAHTHFYNTLLLLYWRIYSDLRGMNSLLTEMEANGVEFDVGTWETLRSVGLDRQKDLDGEGERGKRWWNMMEQRNWWPRVGVEWRELIKRRLEEKGLWTGEVMREERRPSTLVVESEDRPEYLVTL